LRTTERTAIFGEISPLGTETSPSKDAGYGIGGGLWVGMGKAMPKFPARRLPAESESTWVAAGKIPSWASEAFDLTEPTAPPGVPSPCSHASAEAAAIGSRPGPLLTVAEAATALRVSTKTVRRLIARGELRRVSVGRLVRIQTEDMAAYIRDCTDA
jgi:excisionase family DNA binding protein